MQRIPPDPRLQRSGPRATHDGSYINGATSRVGGKLVQPVMKRSLAIASLSIPTAAYGGAGFSDDGIGALFVFASAMLLFTFVATAFLALRLFSGKGARRKSSSSDLAVWAAASFPVSVVLGVVSVATSGHQGLATNLTDSSTYFFGFVVGLFVCALVLPAMLIIGALRMGLFGQPSRRAGADGTPGAVRKRLREPPRTRSRRARSE